jgi:hypothetical protein
MCHKRIKCEGRDWIHESHGRGKFNILVISRLVKLLLAFQGK